MIKCFTIRNGFVGEGIYVCADKTFVFGCEAGINLVDDYLKPTNTKAQKRYPSKIFSKFFDFDRSNVQLSIFESLEGGILKSTQACRMKDNYILEFIPSKKIQEKFSAQITKDTILVRVINISVRSHWNTEEHLFTNLNPPKKSKNVSAVSYKFWMRRLVPSDGIDLPYEIFFKTLSDSLFFINPGDDIEYISSSRGKKMLTHIRYDESKPICITHINPEKTITISYKS